MSNNPFRGGDTFTPICESEKRLDMNAKEYCITYIDGDMVYWRDDTDTPRHRHFAHFLKVFRMTGDAAAAENIMDGSIVTMIRRKPGYGPHKDMTVGFLYRIFGCTPGNIRYTDDVGDGCTIDRSEIDDTFALGLVEVSVEETPEDTPAPAPVELTKPATPHLDAGIIMALLASRGKEITAEQARLILRVIDIMTEF